MYNRDNTGKGERISQMVRTVYADLLFLINFSMDFLCFFLVSRLFCRPISLVRTILASALGGIYAVCSLFLPFRGLTLLFCDAFACVLMCITAEARRGMRFSRFLSEILIFTGVSMALGGVMTAAYTVLNEAGIPESLQSDGDGISAWLFLLLAGIGGGATLLGSRFFRRNSERTYCRVTVSLCGKERTFDAVVDTGNALTDPIGGCPAAAVDASALYGFLPREICEKGTTDPIACFSSLPEQYRIRARLLPVATVTGGGVLLAFRADACYIAFGDLSECGKDAPQEERELLIALTSAKPEGAEMLLPAGIR